MNALKNLMSSGARFLTGIALALFVVVLVQNWAVLNTPITLYLVGGKVAPLGVWLIVTLSVGFIIGMIVSVRQQHGLKKEVARLQSEMSEVRQELDSHRNAALRDETTH